MASLHSMVDLGAEGFSVKLLLSGLLHVLSSHAALAKATFNCTILHKAIVAVR